MNTTISDAHRRFIDEDLHLSPRSRKTYDYAIRKFLAHLERDYGLDAVSARVTDLREDHVTSFAAAEMPPDLRTPEDISSMRTLQTQLAAIRKWYSYLVAFDFHAELSVDKLQTRISAMMPRFTPPPPDVYKAELEKIVEYVKSVPREDTPAKDLRRLKIRAMILFLYRTGVRVSELCALRRRDINMNEGTASIYRAKGGKSRTVLFDAETAEYLLAYWTARRDGGRGTGLYPAFSGRDFPGKPGNHISPRTVEHIVAELCDAAGVEAKVTPHSFRHGLATELVRRRVRESTVQTILGHASPVTTRVYLHMTGQEVAEEYEEAFGPYHKPTGI